MRRLFRWLMRLYPADFRREYGEEIERDAAERGAWKEAIMDIVATAPREHAGQLSATVRQAWRGLRRTPGFSLVALATLAAGIGLNTAIFSVVYGGLFKPLPYPEPERLFVVTESTPDQQMRFALGPDFGSWRKLSKSAQTLAGYSNWSALYAGPDGAEPVEATQVTPEFFAALGIRPHSGRLFGSTDDHPGARATAVVSHRFWERKLGSRTGSSLQLNAAAYEVIGILPAGFEFPGKTDVWVTFREDFAAQRGKDGITLLSALARLRPGVKPEVAATELTGIAIAGWNSPEVVGGFKNMTKGIRAELTPLGESIGARSRPQLLMLMGGVALVLLIACVNVANLFVARAASRTREVAVRLALGAGMGRIARHVWAESMLLASGGAVLGVALAQVLLQLLLAMAGDAVPRANEISIDTTVLAVTALVSLATGLLFGLSPLLFARRTPVNEALKDGARAGGDPALPRLRSTLVAAQLALSLVLLAGAGLLLRSFAALTQVDPGFDPSCLLTLQTHLAPSGSTDRARPVVIEFYRQALERLAALPGVRSVAMVPDLPVSGRFRNMAALEAEGHPYHRKLPMIGARHINPGYFDSLRIPIRYGRAFTPDDFAKSNQIVINEALARSHFGGVDVAGKRMRVLSDDAPWMTVIGVAADVRHVGLHAEPAPEVYRLYTDRDREMDLEMSFALRVEPKVDPKSLIDPSRQALRSLGVGVGVHNFITMEDRIRGTLSQRRFQLWLLGGFSLLAVGLAAIGVYGMVSYMVTQRSHEIGVRMALGATAADIVRLVMRHAWLLALAGLAAGSAVSYWAGQAISKLLFAIKPADPLAIGGAAIILLLVATAAAALPAWRAAAMDPAATLRRDN